MGRHDQMNTGRFVGLLYHDVHPGGAFDYGPIGRSATMYHVAEGTFRRQVRLIQESGLAVIGLEAVRERLANRKRPAARPGVALCFDDGWQGAVGRAAAILAERGLPAFFFITTQLVGQPLFAVPGDLRRLPPGLFTVGSHGVTHRMLSSLRPAEIRRELAESKARLEDLLGRPVTALSLPGGAADRRVLALAEEVGYREIFTSAVGLNPTALGRRSIARIAVRRSTDDMTLRRWLAFRLGRERLRAGVLAVPKRLLGMRAYARLRRLLLGEGSGHRHVFEP
jgi:peptidoglycan/xylan/chitin deacetylase (PgdA/CDA1 family)